MRIFYKLTCICCMLMAVLFVSSCSDDDVDNGQGGYGYIQLRMFKKQAESVSTFGMSGGSRLDYLADAKKVEITLIYKDSEIKQTLNVYSVGGEGAEYGVRTEKLQLLAGQYMLTGYKIYGSKVENGQAVVLQSGSPDETLEFVLKSGGLEVVELSLDVQLRGKVAFMLQKNFKNIDVPDVQLTAAEFQPDSLFNYEEVKFMEVSISAGNGQLPVLDTLNTFWEYGEPYLYTDSLSLKAGKYTLVQYKLMDKKKTTVLVQDPDFTFTVKDNNCDIETVDVVYPANMPAIRDYIALYNIWIAMDGPNWSYSGEVYTAGANWLFKDRPVDEWGYQAGVDLHSNGRVKAVNLGAFNAKGIVPDAIGTLTAMETLYLGTHSDAGAVDKEEVLDMFALAASGVNVQENRMAIQKERLRLRHQKQEQSLLAKDYIKETPFKYTTYKTSMVSETNLISGISPAIGKCQNLSSVYIANGKVTALPDEFGTLENLSDLEIYNCPMTEFPDCLAELPNLVLFNFSLNPMIGSAKLAEGLSNLFVGKSKNKIQIIYLNDNDLEEMPDNMDKLSVLGLLDLAYNKIKTLKPMTRNVSPVQVYLDYNLITSIPDDFCKTDDIETFSASTNQIKEFPSTFSHTTYKASKIDLSDNDIVRFSPNFTGVDVETLNLSFNKLGYGKTLKGKRAMAEELSKYECNINYLQISNNDIDTLQPASFKGLKYLQALECMGNNLRNMHPDFCTEYLPYLSGLELSFNSFAVFPTLVLNVSTLNQLRIQGQRDEQGRRTLKTWPQNLEKHFTLRILDVSYNDIRTVGTVSTSLNYLDVQENPNIDMTLPEELCSRYSAGTFAFYYDDTQYIQGCPALNIK